MDQIELIEAYREIIRENIKYSFLVEQCAPVLLSGKNFREEGARATKSAAKEIGRITYIVRIHLSKTSKENMSGKIKRMLKNEIRKM